MFAHIVAHFIKIVAAYLQSVGIKEHLARIFEVRNQFLDERHEIVLLARWGILLESIINQIVIKYELCIIEIYRKIYTRIYQNFV